MKRTIHEWFIPCDNLPQVLNEYLSGNLSLKRRQTYDEVRRFCQDCGKCSKMPIRVKMTVDISRVHGKKKA